MPDISSPHQWPEDLIGVMPFEWEGDLTEFCNWDVVT